MAFPLSPGVNFTEIDLTTVVPNVATTDGAIAGLFRWGPIDERVLIDSEDLLVARFAKPTNYNAETFFTAADFLAYGNRLYVSRAANTSGATPVVANCTVNTDANGQIFEISPGNTASLANGMYITQISNTSVISTTGKSANIVVINSTSFHVPSTITTANGSVDLYFGRAETSYTAVAFDEDDSTTAYAANLVNQIVLNETRYANKDGNFDSDVIYVAKYPGEIGNSLRISVCDAANSFRVSFLLQKV